MLRLNKHKLRNLSLEFGFSFVALFGSRLKEKKSFKKDFDFAVLLQRPLDIERQLMALSRFSQILKSDNLDLVILNFASPLLQYEVAREGSLLYEKVPGSFNVFRSLAIRKWNDNKKFADLDNIYINDFIREKALA